MIARLLWRSVAINTAALLAIGAVAHSRHLHGTVSDATAIAAFLVNMVVGYVVGPAYGHAVRSFVVTVMAVSWALRLMWYVVFKRLLRFGQPTIDSGRKHHKSHGDERIDNLIDGTWWRAAGWWLGQSVWVSAVLLPVMACNLSRHDDTRGFWTAWDRYGIMLWLVGWVMESVADEQRFLFNATPSSLRPSPFIADGLWSWSRHPNYCGEFLNWLGIWMVCVPVLDKTAAIVTFLSSPVFTLLLLTKVTGIPQSEVRDDKRFGRLPAYLQYKYCTSPFFPMPPRLYAQLESGVRKYLLFESFQPKVRRVKRTLLSNSLASSPNK